LLEPHELVHGFLGEVEGFVGISERRLEFSEGSTWELSLPGGRVLRSLSHPSFRPEKCVSIEVGDEEQNFLLVGVILVGVETKVEIGFCDEVLIFGAFAREDWGAVSSLGGSAIGG
jgi:hypothetical protein